jgi:hypothetical protein
MTAIRLFNGPVEVGLRTLVLLVEAFPDQLDLQRLITMDYLLIHSGDIAGGPQSLHPPSPLRAGEVAIRRGLIQEGLHLYRSRGLIGQHLSKTGICYAADDSASAFLDALSSTYVTRLRERAEWVFHNVGLLDEHELTRVLNDSLGHWRTEFAILATDENSQ